MVRLAPLQGNGAPLFAAARSITFPLIGWRRGQLPYTVFNAARQAWAALYQYFNTTLAGPHSESVPPGTNAARLATLTAARRAAFDGIYLTIPNGYGVYNAAPTAPNTRPRNTYGVEIGEQEMAWFVAFL